MNSKTDNLSSKDQPLSEEDLKKIALADLWLEKEALADKFKEKEKEFNDLLRELSL